MKKTEATWIKGRSFEEVSSSGLGTVDRLEEGAVSCWFSPDSVFRSPFPHMMDQPGSRRSKWQVWQGKYSQLQLRNSNNLEWLKCHVDECCIELVILFTRETMWRGGRRSSADWNWNYSSSIASWISEGWGWGGPLNLSGPFIRWVHGANMPVNKHPLFLNAQWRTETSSCHWAATELSHLSPNFLVFTLHAGLFEGKRDQFTVSTSIQSHILTLTTLSSPICSPVYQTSACHSSPLLHYISRSHFTYFDQD